MNMEYKNNNLLKIRRREIFFAILVLLIISIVLGKYISLSITGKDMLFNIEKFLIKIASSQYGKNKNDIVEVRYYILKRNSNGVWGLYSNNKLANEYEILNIDGKIGIQRRLPYKYRSAINVDVAGVRNYFKRSSFITTDIPYTEGVSRFSVTEQEDLFPIFGYHNVFENEDDIVDPYIDMRKSDFEEQLNFLNQNMNCRWYTLSQIVQDFLIQKKKIPRNTCVMTFDDGRSNNFEIVLPMLKKYQAKATFFIIIGRAGQESYMSNWQVGQLYRSGNEIGSHSLLGGSLIDTSWYTEGPFTQEVLWKEINHSKEILNEYGYNAKLFAHPLGDYNDNIISTLKKSGYLAARASPKKNSWRSPRALATSMDRDFIWHLNYYEPELKFSHQIYSDMGYDGWWQFEEGFESLNDKNSNIRELSLNQPNKQSYGSVFLEDDGDAIMNSFILENTGTYIIDIFASTSALSETEGFKAIIDQLEVTVNKDLTQDCVKVGEDNYCHYLIQRTLYEGEHFLTVINIEGKTLLDRFRINRLISPHTTYSIKIEEFK